MESSKVKPYVTGSVETPVGQVPRVATALTRADMLGRFKVLWSIGRMDYTVDPGLYAVGRPDEGSYVFVSANYKLSFDTLRSELDGLNAWIMVLDTKGINVWCAAGKGTFGTQEMVSRIAGTRLAEIVNHRTLIVPQLGAPGVAAHEVKRLSGFAVAYGPVRARDIRAFLDARLVATPEMRQVRFPLLDRLRLVPVEVTGGVKYLVAAVAVSFLLAGVSRNGYSVGSVATDGIRSARNLLVAYLTGTALGPVLLPWLPGRSFSFKGFTAGIAAFAVLFVAGLAGKGRLEIMVWMLLLPAVASFLTMNFTGASTYTSLSGVRREMRIAVPLQILSGGAGVGFWIASRLI